MQAWVKREGDSAYLLPPGPAKAAAGAPSQAAAHLSLYKGKGYKAVGEENAKGGPQPPVESEESGEEEEGGGGNELGLRCTGSYCPQPPLRYLGGTVQHETKVHVVFWGKNWNESPGSSARATIYKFFEGLSGSAYQGVLTQYFDPTSRISPNVTVDSYVDTRAAAPTSVGYESFGSEVAYALEQNPAWKRENDVQFDILPAPGTTYAKGFSGFCAYHDIDSKGGIFTAVPYAGDPPFSTENGCQGYYGKGDAAKATSLMASHEYTEAATDPLWNSKPGWTDVEGYENADMCATPYDELPNGSFVQGTYDDHQSACSIADEKPPYVLGLTESATKVAQHGAALKATINPESLETTYHFEYGKTTSYGTSVPSKDVSVGSGRENVQVEQAISGLEVEQAYHYRVAATNSSGTTYGEDRMLFPSRWQMRNVPRKASWQQDFQTNASCASDGSCMAVGQFYDASYAPAELNRLLALQSIGSEWVEREVPEPGLGYPSLNDVSCTSAHACTAVGGGYAGNEEWLPIVERWNGEKWTKQEVPLAPGAVGGFLYGVSCMSATECIAVGTSKTSKGVWNAKYLARWKEGTWTIMSSSIPSETTGGALNDVSCTSSNFCTAVGWGESGILILHWNGSEWASQTPSASKTVTVLSGVSCVSPAFCMAVSYWGPSEIEIWNGSEWSTLTPAEPVQGQIHGHAWNGVSCTSKVNCVVAGYGWSTVNGRALALSERWNGSSWSEEITPRTSEISESLLTGVSCLSIKTCTAVGVDHGSGSTRSLLETREMPVTPSHLSSFGSKGSGSGQFSTPLGLAAEASGNVWVADSGNNRIEKFTSSGTFLAAWGWGVADGQAKSEVCTSSCQAGISGSGNGQFKGSGDIAIDSSGNLWVVDGGNYRIEKFNSNGEYLSQFGSYGYGNGQFRGPNGIAIAPSGHIWVSDWYGRVEEFTAAGEFIQSISGGWPAAIAVDQVGNVWVANFGPENNVAKIDPKEGKYVSEFGSWGNGSGQFENLQAIDVMPSGNLVVADRSGARVQEFTQSGEFVTGFGGWPEIGSPYGIAADTHGVIYVSSAYYNQVQKWCGPTIPEANTQAVSSVQSTEATLKGTVNPRCVATSYRFEYGPTTEYGSQAPAEPEAIGSGTDDVTVTQTIKGLKSHKTYHYRLVAENAEGTTYGEDKPFTTSPTYLSSFGSLGSGNGQFNNPAGMAVNTSGDLWIADSANNRVEKFDTKGEYQSQFGSTGTGNGQFKTPVDIAITAGGDLWVTDAINARVEKFNAKGEYLSQFGSYGGANGQFYEPSGVAIAPNGHIWVTDFRSYRVQEFTASGEFIQSVGPGYGGGPGEFFAPSGIAIDPEGHVYVADNRNNRVQELSSSGGYLAQFGTYGSGDGQFENPEKIEVTSSGHLLVDDRWTERVQEFSSSGEYITQFSLGSPHKAYGIAASGPAIYISDSSSDDVGKWCMPVAPEASTQAASGVKSTEATLNAAVNPMCTATTYQFEYGTTTAYGSKVPTTPKSIGSGTDSVAITEAVKGLTSGQTYHFRIAATNEEGTTYGKDETVTVGTGPALMSMAITEPFNGGTESLANFGSKWSTLGWAGGSTPKGSDTTTGWRPVDAYSTVNGAYYNTTVTDTGSGIAAVATMAVNPGNTSRYFSVWLDMGTPSSTRAGYELRFTNTATNTYEVKLSKWVSGTQTVLATKTGYSFSNGNSFAVVDQGGTVSAWTKTGFEYIQLLSASDSAFSSGNAAVEGSGNITRLTNFKVGSL